MPELPPISAFDLTLATPAENLALDEALLETARDEDLPGFLRFWEANSHFVVLGYSNRWSTEANEPACASRGIPVLRRCTGGGTVLQGPGCWNFGLVLRIADRPELESITSTNRYIMERHRAIFEQLLGRPTQIQGHTDLTLGDLKFAGNAQRRCPPHLLFHGSVLLGLDLDLLGAVLNMPSSAPHYRKGRGHADFVVNVPVDREDLRTALVKTWGANLLPSVPPRVLDRSSVLAAAKYTTQTWNQKC